MLGDKYRVINEGLGGRTTNLEHPTKPGRNGKAHLASYLKDDNPIDIVILMLGTNDLKTTYGRTAEDVAVAVSDLIKDISTYARGKSSAQPDIILISPIHINDRSPLFGLLYSSAFDARSATESKRLTAELQKVAIKNKTAFIDAALVASPGADGIHLPAESMAQLARAIANKISQLGN